MQRSCLHCSSTFEIRNDDLAFYEKVSPAFEGKAYAVPPPTLCPGCRRQRRLARRNERSLFHRTCDRTGKHMLSIYHPQSPYTIFAVEEWWSDRWDPKSSGREFDFSRTFRSNFDELSAAVPRMALHVLANENCEFVNQCGYSKNCYLSFNCDYSEDCFYCTNVIRSKNCLDLLNAEQCELCCESMDIHTCYNVARSRNCKNSSDLRHCQNLQACRHCFGCINLRNREYCFLNEQCSREEYERHIEPYCRGEWSKEREMEQMFAEHALRFPRKHLEMLQCERSLGDNLTNCKNTYQCFDSFKNEDIAYCTITSNCKDSQDGDTGGYDCELCYEMISSGMNNQRCLFGSNYWGGCDGALYCEVVKDCRDCFGCICLRNARYCILNKQCTKEEYDAIAPKMIDHMRRTGEWGEFHPIESSPFAYNESVAMDYVPLTKEEVLKHAWMWRDRSDEKLKVERMIPCHALPDSIADIPDDIFNWAIQCEATKRPFRIIKQELDFYRSQNLTIPHLHPDERHRLRMLMRNPRKLWKRVCAKCAKEIQTSYSPDRPEIVYCEECYLATVC